MTSKPQSQKPELKNRPVDTSDKVAGDIQIIDITGNTVIRKKVRQCLAILLPPPTDAPGTAKSAEKRSSKKPKIVGIRAVHPSAGSKAITIAEIVKREIAASADKDVHGKPKGIWWQYTKLESKLVELPPRKARTELFDNTEQADRERETDGKTGDNIDVDINSNKRKQDGSDSRASKKPKLNHSLPQIIDSEDGKGKESQPIPISSSSTPKAAKKRRRNQFDGAYDDSDDEVPAHLRQSSNPLGDSDREDGVPPQGLSGSASKPGQTENMPLELDSDDRPPHLRNSSPEMNTAHIRGSSPKLYSDTRPNFLRDSSPGDRPPHLQSSTTSTPKPQAGSARQEPLDSSSPIIPRKDQDEDMLTSSPPPPPLPEESSNEDEDDDYRQFTFLDIEHLPEKHAKRILEDIDEAERNRKKYRAIAVMTIYLSLEKRPDLEKLYGVQTNFGERGEGKK